MPCNAISTATAVVSNEEMMKHADLNMLLEVLVEHFREKGHTVTSTRNMVDAVRIEIDGIIAITVNRRGQVTVQDYRYRYTQEDQQALAGEVRTLVEETAGILFQAKMIETISGIVPVLGQEVIPTEAGEAVSMTVNLNGILSRIIILTNGEISVYTDEGTFADGADGIKKLFDSLAATVTFESISEPEQHRHDGTDKAHEYLHAHHHAQEHGRRRR